MGNSSTQKAADIKQVLEIAGSQRWASSDSGHSDYWRLDGFKIDEIFTQDIRIHQIVITPSYYSESSVLLFSIFQILWHN
jgi:hypothetical protein